MVAPGANLDFGESSAFKARVHPLPEVRNAVMERLKSAPHDGLEIAGGYRLLDLAVDGEAYAIIFRRAGNRFGLINAFELPRQQNLLDEELRSIKQGNRGRIK